MKKSAIALSALLIAGSAGTQALAAEFTADAVETKPGQQLRYGKLTVKDHLSRFEFQVQGNPVVQITDKTANITRFLSPLSHTYFEIPKTPDAATDGDFAYASPCPKVENVKCVKDRDETLGGYKVEKYRISADKVKRSAYVWWEPTRKMALRREYLNGSVQQMIMHGVMPYDNGRKAENWEVIYMSPFGRYLRGSIQFDADLGVAIMQNFPNGISRSLNNINVKKIEDSLFSVPDNYKKVDAPKKPRGPFGPSRLEKFSGQTGAQPVFPGNRAGAYPNFAPHNAPAMPEWVKKAHEKAMKEQKEAMEKMRKAPDFKAPKMPEWVKKAQKEAMKAQKEAMKAHKEAMEKMRKAPDFKAPEMPEWVKKARKEAEARMKAQAKINGFQTPPWVKYGPGANNAGFGNAAPGNQWGPTPWGQYQAPRPGYFPGAPYGYPARRPYAPGFNQAPRFYGAQPVK